MFIFLVITVVIAVVGVVLLAAMFHRNDNRLGLAGLGALITANVLAMVHAALNV